MLSGGTTMFQVIIERTTKEQMALFPVTREGHGSERLVSRRWPSIPQHGDQAYNAVVKVRIWISRLCFSDALLTHRSSSKGTVAFGSCLHGWCFKSRRQALIFRFVFQLATV